MCAIRLAAVLLGLVVFVPSCFGESADRSTCAPLCDKADSDFSTLLYYANKSLTPSDSLNATDCMCVDSSNLSMLEIWCNKTYDTELVSYNCTEVTCNNVTDNNLTEINVTNCSTVMIDQPTTVMSCELYCDTMGNNVSTRLYANESILTSDSLNIRDCTCESSSSTLEILCNGTNDTETFTWYNCTPMPTSLTCTSSSNSTTLEINVTNCNPEMTTATVFATTISSVAPTPASATTTSSMDPTTASAITTSSMVPTTASAITTSSMVPPSYSMTTTSTSMTHDQAAFTIRILWIVLGCLIGLIIVVLTMICCFATTICKRRFKGKKPTAMDIASKWKDAPADSMDVQLMSVKSIDEDNETQETNVNVKVEETSEVTNEAKKDEASDEGNKSKEKDGDDITLGTFGFPEIAVEPTAPKTGTSEKKDSPADNQDGPSEKKEQKDVAIEEEKMNATAVTTTKESSTPGNSECTIPKDKHVDTAATTNASKADAELQPEENAIKPVPVSIPVIEKQLKEATKGDVSLDKAPEQATCSSTSPSKEQASTSETPTSIKDIANTEKVSKGTEAAAASPQQPVLPGSASDKVPPATSPPSLLSNEQLEKALGVSVKSMDQQEESTQL